MWFTNKEEPKSKWLFVFYNSHSYAGNIHLYAIYPEADKEKAMEYMLANCFDYLELRTAPWDGKGPLPVYGNTDLLECKKELKDRQEYIRLKAKYETGEMK